MAKVTQDAEKGGGQAVPANFEAAMGELERILADIERGEVSLEESLAKYDRGTFLIQHCRKVLGEAERRVEMLTRGEDGGVRAGPMEESDRVTK